MKSLFASRKLFLVLGLACVLVLALACAKSAEKAAAPAPSAEKPAAPVAAPAPAAPSAPAAPATPTSAAPSAPAYTSLIRQTNAKYGPEQLPKWEKAKYGGIMNLTGWMQPAYYNPTKYSALHGHLRFGTMLLYDAGVCSMVGRADFSVCPPGTPPAKRSAIVTVPGIVQRWDQPDPLTYVFHVRKGVLWPTIPPMNRTNRELTAEDIKYDWEIFQTASIHTDTFNVARKVEVQDRYTLKITLKEPTPDFIRAMTSPSFGLFPRECYEEKDCMDNKILSPAPYLLKRSEPRVSAFFERNPEFYLKGLPYVDGVQLTNITDYQAIKAAFFTGKIDHTVDTRATSLEVIDLYKKQVPGVQISMAAGPGGHLHDFMHLDVAPFNDVRVRQALSMAVDRPAMWELGGGLLADTGILVPIDYFPEWYPNGPPLDWFPPSWKFDPAKAKELLAAAGYPNGFKVVVNSAAPGFDAETVLQSMWKKNVNVDVQITSLDFVAYVNMIFTGKWDGLWSAQACYIPLCGSYDADSYLSTYYGPALLNKSRNHDPEYDAMYLRQHNELDPAKRRELLKTMAWYIQDKVLVFHWGMRYFTSFIQPWVFNAETLGYFDCGYNSCTFASMIDTDKKPK